LIIGVFMGPTQSASRSLMARLSPPDLTTEMFGLFALTGKATAFLGPWLVGMITLAANSQRIGMSVILVFLVLGLAILLGVREPRG
jgi:UMF1 family MFS transporter